MKQGFFTKKAGQPDHLTRENGFVTKTPLFEFMIQGTENTNNRTLCNICRAYSCNRGGKYH